MAWESSLPKLLSIRSLRVLRSDLIPRNHTKLRVLSSDLILRNHLKLRVLRGFGWFLGTQSFGRHAGIRSLRVLNPIKPTQSLLNTSKHTNKLTYLSLLTNNKTSKY